jgi:hypothetical protein
MAGWVVVMAALSVLAAAPKPDAFAVGALRRDGVIIPFAVFDGKHWSMRWPNASATELDIPITLGAVPKLWWGPTGPLAQWTIWNEAGQQTVDVTQPDWIDAHCLRQIGLKTRYRSPRPLPPPTEQPYPKDGLAIAPPQPVEAIDLVPASAPEVQALRAELLAAFNKAERLVESNYGHPITPRSREGIEPTVEAVYAYGADPRVYYVEAIRMYRRLGQAAGACEATAFGSGWFVREHGVVRSLTEAVDLLRCDRYGASYMLPFGLLRLKGKTYWLAQFSGWDRERFVVIEIQKKNVEAVINVNGGFC